MTFTYTLGGTADRDRVRFKIGDTDSAAPASERLEDEEIAGAVTLGGSWLAAAAACAGALAAKFARKVTAKTVKSASYHWQRYRDLMNLKKEIERDLSLAGALPYLSGSSHSDVAAARDDTDRVQPPFRIGMLDNPRT